MDGKIIHDGVHGSMKITGLILDLVKTPPEFQRLRNIRQLGLAYLVYPGANHTRFEHSLGAWHIARRLSQEIGLNEDESMLLQVGGPSPRHRPRASATPSRAYTSTTSRSTTTCASART